MPTKRTLQQKVQKVARQKNGRIKNCQDNLMVVASRLREYKSLAKAWRKAACHLNVCIPCRTTYREDAVPCKVGSDLLVCAISSQYRVDNH